VLVGILFLRNGCCYNRKQNYNILFRVLDCVPFLRTFLCVYTSALQTREHATSITWTRLRLKRDGTGSENRFRLSPKRTSLFKSAGASVQSTSGSRGVRISVSNAGYTTFRGSVRVLATHSIRQFPLHFPSHASPCAIRFQTHPTNDHGGVRALDAGGSL
jgi:hypothetical protein